MKNLKRILSLALASVMVMGMMVVGASAADFNDKDQIDHAEAVETLVALGIISGKENNRFDPKGNLTRAEMATIIAVIRNKGIAPKFGTKPTPTYTDIDNHWAESYIEYCNSFGIVGGIGGGKFDPEGKLTSTQAARMLLNAMGYTISDPSNWALLTEVQAREEGVDLYAGIDEEIADPTNTIITRDQMAQMAYNALNGNMADAEVVITTYYELTVTGAEATAAKLQGEVYSSAADAAAVAESHGLKPTGTTGATKTYAINKQTKDTTEKLGEKYLGTQTKDIVVSTVKYDKDEKGYKVNNEYVVAEDVSNLIGHNVTVLYKNVGSNIKTYGFVDNSVVLAEGNLGGKELTLADTFDKIAVKDQNTNTSVFLNTFTTTGKEYNKVVAVSDNGKTVARLVTTPVKFGTVGYVGSTQFTVTGVDTYTTSKVDVYEGIKKNDQVLVTPAANTADNKAKIEKAPVTEGAKVDATKGTDQVRVNGTWYTANTTAIFDGLKTLGEFDVVILNGYIVSQKAAGQSAAAAGVADVFMVTAVGDFAAASSFKGTPALYPVRIITATGEVTELNVAGIWNSTNEEYDEVTDTQGSAVAPAANTLYTAEKDENGNYNLTAVATTGEWSKLDAEDLGTNKIEKGQVTISGTKYRFDNDAVVFVHSTGKFKAAVIKGSEVNVWGETTPTAGTIYSADKNGFPYVSMAIIDLGAAATLPGQAATEGLGWIISDKAAYVKVNDKAALEMEIFDGETTRTVTVTSLKTGSIDAAAAAAYTKGKFVTFEESTNNTIGKLAVADGLVADAITAFDGDETFKLTAGGEQKLESDKWTVMYVDTKNGKGVEGAAIQMAAKSDLGDFIENVYADATNKILVVDVNNVLAELATEVEFETGAVITAVNDARTEATVAASTSGNDLVAAAKALTGAKNAKVIDATGEAVTTADVAAGNILQVTTESGRMYNLTIKIAE